MIIIVVIALIAIVLAVFDVTFQPKYRGTSEGIIKITIPEVVKLDDSFYEDSLDQIPVSKQSVLPLTTNKEENIPQVIQYPDGITSRAYIVGNLRTGEIYVSRNSRLALPIASMSKLMTAYVGIQVLTPTTTIEIAEENTKVYPDSSNLTTGEKFTFDMILYPLLLNSSNVAAEAIATTYGRTDFLELMSGYAWEIGLPSSFFTDPSGLSPQNRASAQGFFELTKYIYETERELFTITKTSDLTVSTTTEYGTHRFINIHPYIKDPRFLGGKTGRTPEAGDTMLTILDIGGEPVAFIVLGGAYDKRKTDTDLLIMKLQKLITELNIIPTV